MTRRSRSSGRWLQEHFADPYVQRAQAAGWRSRAVFKLEEIDRRAHLLHPGAVCLDLGAAPGAWSQYARRRVGAKGRVVATDLLPMAELAGVEFVQGDFREDEVFERILALLPARGVDLVLSDLAPNLSGVDVIDQPRSMYLAELALAVAARFGDRPDDVRARLGFEPLQLRAQRLRAAQRHGSAPHAPSASLCRSCSRFTSTSSR